MHNDIGMHWTRLTAKYQICGTTGSNYCGAEFIEQIVPRVTGLLPPAPAVWPPAPAFVPAAAWSLARGALDATSRWLETPAGVSPLVWLAAVYFAITALSDAELTLHRPGYHEAFGDHARELERAADRAFDDLSRLPDQRLEASGVMLDSGV